MSSTNYLIAIQFLLIIAAGTIMYEQVLALRAKELVNVMAFGLHYKIINRIILRTALTGVS